LVVTFSVIGFGEAARPARWINLPLGFWLLAAPWVFSGFTLVSQWNDLAIGLAVIVLTIRRGPIQSRFGSWDRYVV
jgi:hypothetical protein